MDQIEQDDSKFEELLMLQSMAETETAYDSVEEKYEEELMMKQVMEIVDRQLSQRNWADLDEEDEELLEEPKRP